MLWEYVTDGKMLCGQSVLRIEATPDMNARAEFHIHRRRSSLYKEFGKFGAEDHRPVLLRL
eukprot:5835698-Pleurochrysis_carterae.AAC.1